MSRRRGRCAAGFAALALLSGCSLRYLLLRPPRLAECAGSVAPSERIHGDFVSRLQIQIDSERVSAGYDLVLQKKGERLVLIGLTRFGATAFSVVQEGRRLSAQSALGPATVVPPVNVMRDVHRARFLSVAAGGGTGAFEDRRDGEQIRETWRDGTLVRRVFTSADGVVEVHFLDAATVRIDNRRCGYQATLVDLGEIAPAGATP